MKIMGLIMGLVAGGVFASSNVSDLRPKSVELNGKTATNLFDILEKAESNPKNNGLVRKREGIDGDAHVTTLKSRWSSCERRIVPATPPREIAQRFDSCTLVLLKR